MPILRRGKEKIYHIDHLPEKMRVTLKTVMDVNLHDIAKYYGLKYLTPRVGEPIFIPYGELNGKFNSYEDAFEKIYEAIEEIKEEGHEEYKQWYPNAVFLDHYRIVFYSTTEYGEGVIYGIGAEPLADLKPSLDISKDDIVVIGMSVRIPSAKYYDVIRNRRDEIIEAYNQIYSEFHAKYDKDKVYVIEVATYYMKKFFDVVDNYFKTLNFTNNLKGKTAVIPLFSSPAKKDGKIIDIWREYFKNYFEEGNYYKLEALQAIYNEEFINKILSVVKDNFEEIILVSEKKPRVPDLLKDLKITKEGENYVMLSR
ncbi:hypothetical protein [Sulfurisphaera tokodaii]|uniref:Uncharacterized protein n=2 Tax=Sulfurisphaera tokodaii TaxID=111955 RepID=Q974M2_SULTO|nr:hypothetical protein [Sulfurisphaera tokodaii]BAB65635.1 hypothetical protein STK_06370 [Sulfurisphaera tokodaii str. 7]HII74660.1 hypothetical protein [Sulfurisphaera tokodaii]